MGKKKEDIQFIDNTPDFIKRLKAQSQPEQRKERDLPADLKEDEQPVVVLDPKLDKKLKLGKLETVIKVEGRGVEKSKANKPLSKKLVQKLKNKNLVSFDE